MKKTLSITLCLFLSLSVLDAQIDMQAHVASDDGAAAYSAYKAKQADYYTGDYAYGNLCQNDGETLFHLLNTLMGNTCRTDGYGLSYNTLRYAYGAVDSDLNSPSNFIAFYSGTSADATWDSGSTWNREHVWPQSKGAKTSSPMGYDMLSVRPALTKDNSTRGNDGYGEGSGFYDPDELAIKNPYYKRTNNGTYRGDCARIILYDYLVYGEMNGYKNDLYNGKAQLLDKLGNSEAVFESLAILFKWHMQDPPSLTEIVRNDGGQDYQGNRNPFIDYPELALLMLKNEITTYEVTTNMIMQPAHRLTTQDGFVAYLGKPDGSHPKTIAVSGAGFNYDPNTGRLTLGNVTDNVSILTDEITSLEQYRQPLQITVSGNTVTLHDLHDTPLTIYSLSGMTIYEQPCAGGDLTLQLPQGLYVVRAGNLTDKIIVL